MMSIHQKTIHQKTSRKQSVLAAVLFTGCNWVGWGAIGPATAQTSALRPTLRIVVNSNQDGPMQADQGLTLREAIALANGTRTLEQLSAAEQAQVSPSTTAVSEITFQLPTGQTQIQLTQSLPALENPVVIDGTTQPGYDATTQLIDEIAAVRVPVVEITPAAGVEILRGLTITSDRVTIRGLSLYGFTSRHLDTASTPPADILIAHRLPPPDISQQQSPATNAPFRDTPPRDILLENNWLGIRPDQTMPATPSAFGVSVFNGTNVTIKHNWIANHDGSGIITAVNASDMNVTENVIVSNGLAGMPDGIRLEGEIDRTQITGNVICANDGSGVYLFKPEGSAQINNNKITFNGRRYRRAAVYLMGNQHQVMKNEIAYQAGPGVVVAAYPDSSRNVIQDNRFGVLEGLSVDLVTQGNVGVQDYQKGDGLNPRRTSPNRRKDTGNGSINAPRFSARTFPLEDNRVSIVGTADPGSQVEIYKVKENSADAGPLNEALFTTAKVGPDGKFTSTIENGFKLGDRVSAIATDPQYGTSEPAVNAIVGAPVPTDPIAPPTLRCTNPPKPPAPPEQPPERPPAVKITVPKNVHFALDRDNISPASAKILDRVAQVLLENPTIIVDLQGHTDPRASDAYNLDLGERRAKSVRAYLMRQGIDSTRMTFRSFGERRLISPGRTRVDFARDRRVELIYKDIRDIEVIVQEEDLQIEP
jgi:outer membrane protein OmpA-like peptidoglycan-associated protein